MSLLGFGKLEGASGEGHEHDRGKILAVSRWNDEEKDWYCNSLNRIEPAEVLLCHGCTRALFAELGRAAGVAMAYQADGEEAR